MHIINIPIQSISKLIPENQTIKHQSIFQLSSAIYDFLLNLNTSSYSSHRQYSQDKQRN